MNYISKAYDYYKRSDKVMENIGIPASPEAKATETSLVSDNKTHEEILKELEVAEKRRRETQSAYTKERQRVLALEAEMKALKSELGRNNAYALPSEIEELKFQDPDAYYAARREYEDKLARERESRIAQTSEQTLQEAQYQYRLKYLEDFNRRNPDFKLTAEFIDNELPPRFVKELEANGDFEGFCEKAYKWATAGKVLGGGTPPPPKQPDLNSLGGGSSDDKPVFKPVQYF